MDQENHLILLRGADKTREISRCVYNSRNQTYRISFGTEKEYSYTKDCVQWMRRPKRLDPAVCRIRKKEGRMKQVEAISVFSGTDQFWHLRFTDGSSQTFRRSELRISFSCLEDRQAKKSLAYLQALAQTGDLKNEEGKTLLGVYAARMEFIDAETALPCYLSPGRFPIRNREQDGLIFPFGSNASQLQAVRAAMTHQISVIQGPPGTGKTQTILNLIANLVVEKKTVLVVSNNNAATEHIMEKLQSADLDFMAAFLGKQENKKQFIENQPNPIPKLPPVRNLPDLLEQISVGCRELLPAMRQQQHLARVRQEERELNLEWRYFQAYCEDRKIPIPKDSCFSGSAAALMELLLSWETCTDNGCAPGLGIKLKAALMGGEFGWKLMHRGTALASLQALYYQLRLRELNGQCRQMERNLAGFDFGAKRKQLTALSGRYLRGRLHERYGSTAERVLFQESDLRRNPDAFLQEYPVVFSTTFSSVNCLPGAVFDYVIIDEASQADLVTGALSLSCGKNAVIVGDLKQLPNVVTREEAAQTDAIFRAYKMPQGYEYAGNSFLSSICQVIPDVPRTMLREHYRCHPKIIQFCNQKFYHQQLLVMTGDHGEKNALSIFQAPAGACGQGHINQKQIDLVTEKVLPSLRRIAPSEIGLIAPYRDQALAVEAAIHDPEIEADTVHKFQGREKKAIVLMTVDDQVTEFSDDPYLLNVAVSRAKERLCLVTSGACQPQDSNFQDLIAYIRYQNGQLQNSRVYPVFDLLYQRYTEKRMTKLKKRRFCSASRTDAMMYTYLSELLHKMPDLNLRIAAHVPMRLLLRDLTGLTPEEKEYVCASNSHLDFLIYNQISKMPVLAIEADGGRPEQMKTDIIQKYGIRLQYLTANKGLSRQKIRQILPQR